MTSVSVRVGFGVGFTNAVKLHTNHITGTCTYFPPTGVSISIQSPRTLEPSSRQAPPLEASQQERELVGHVPDKANRGRVKFRARVRERVFVGWALGG